MQNFGWYTKFWDDLYLNGTTVPFDNVSSDSMEY